MTMRARFLCSIAIASVFALSACNNTVQLSPGYLSVSMSPRPTSIAAGTTQVFTAAVSNNLSSPQWSFLDASQATSLGTLTPVSGSPDAILYTAPATPPIYNVTTGITQGTVTLDVKVTDPPGTSIPTQGDSVTVIITAPSVAVNLTPATASVPLGGSQQFFGYAVGSINNTLIWQVNGVTDGAVPVPLSNPITYTYPYGSINTAGMYVAPANYPTTGNTVTITIISQADPTKTASSTVTLQ